MERPQWQMTAAKPTTRPTEEIAKKYARLNDEQRQEFHKSVNRVIEKNGEVSDQHRLAVANTLLQPLRGIEQQRQIKEAERREEQRAFWNDLRRQHEPQGAIKQAQPRLSPVRQGGDQATPDPAKHDSLMAGVRPSGAHRNYAELKKTHQQVASALKQDDGPAAAQQYELSKEHLQGMLDHYEALRRTGNISPTPEEMRERDDVFRLQQTSCVELEQKHGPHPNAHQQEERKLMDHQHLAEQVGVEARWMAQHLRKQQAPGAETYESDARRAFHTARITHERRQKSWPRPGSGARNHPHCAATGTTKAVRHARSAARRYGDDPGPARQCFGGCETGYRPQGTRRRLTRRRCRLHGSAGSKRDDPPRQHSRWGAFSLGSRWRVAGSALQP